MIGPIFCAYGGPFGVDRQPHDLATFALPPLSAANTFVVDENSAPLYVAARDAGKFPHHTRIHFRSSILIEDWAGRTYPPKADMVAKLKTQADAARNYGCDGMSVDEFVTTRDTVDWPADAINDFTDHHLGGLDLVAWVSGPDLWWDGGNSYNLLRALGYRSTYTIAELYDPRQSHRVDSEFIRSEHPLSKLPGQAPTPQDSDYAHFTRTVKAWNEVLPGFHKKMVLSFSAYRNNSKRPLEEMDSSVRGLAERLPLRYQGALLVRDQLKWYAREMDTLQTAGVALWGHASTTFPHFGPLTSVELELINETFGRLFLGQ